MDSKVFGAGQTLFTAWNFLIDEINVGAPYEETIEMHRILINFEF